MATASAADEVMADFYRKYHVPRSEAATDCTLIKLLSSVGRQAELLIE